MVSINRLIHLKRNRCFVECAVWDLQEIYLQQTTMSEYAHLLNYLEF
jgi:hypothetical protein